MSPNTGALLVQPSGYSQHPQFNCVAALARSPVNHPPPLGHFYDYMSPYHGGTKFRALRFLRTLAEIVEPSETTTQRHYVPTRLG